MFTPLIKDLVLEERPREKMLTHGIQALSDAELIAIIIGTGTKSKSAIELGKEIISHFGSLQSLARADSISLQELQGIGKVKALMLQAAFELGRRKVKEKPNEICFTSSQEVADYLSAAMADLAHEECRVLFLDRKNALIADKLISKGGVSTTVIDQKIIFKEALKLLASGIILSHNHPSGNIQPSNADIEITKKLVKCGEIMDVKVLDHVIIAKNEYYSFLDHGKI